MTHVVVVGAGAFGGWTALWLLRRGTRVTLVDAWGPGSSRASSGGETRVIRAVYGPDPLYIDWVVRAFPLWRQAEARWGERLYHRTGALWMFDGADDYARACRPLLDAAGWKVDELTAGEARSRFPQIDLTGLATFFWEEEAGYLLARRACQAVARAVVEEGGEYRQLEVRPGPVAGGVLERLDASDGSALTADAYVFAAGPWLGRLLPEAIGAAGVRPTRQEVYYFGTPAGDPRWIEGACPIWLEFGENLFYGIPGNEHRGFKVADDTRGEPFDPTDGDRTVTPALLERARAFLARRFPGLAGAPLVESRVCQYENTPDGDFLLDRHPEAGNAWIVGGGSGHGFKLGPVVGEHAADLVLGRAEPLPRFSVNRLRAAAGAAPRTQFDL